MFDLCRFIYLSILTYSILLISSCSVSDKNKSEMVKQNIDIEILKEAKKFCEMKNMNSDFFIFIDMRIHSGKKRFFVWDFKSEKIIHSFLVSHGCGKNPWSSDESKDSPSFSNTLESHCSSLGKYKIGKRGYSNWGVHIKYLLHGLEKSNSNALKRDIVFHSWNAIADNEVFPSGTPEGWGCPAISNKNFIILDKLLKKSEKPSLMWIYNG